MDRLLNLQTALSLGYVASMLGAAHLSSRLLLPRSSSFKTRCIFLWLAFDAICHLTLEASFLYLSVQSRTVASSAPSFFRSLWIEYAAADARWAKADPTLVAMECVTVLIAGPLAAYCAWLLAKGDKTYHYWAVVLSTAELYGGWMTFAPEWLVGSASLETQDWLLLWVYLVVMNLVWVVVPLALMVDSYRFIAQSLSESTVKDTTVPGALTTQHKVKPTQPRVLSSARGLSGSAYLVLLAVLFFHIMPTSVSASSSPASPISDASLYDPSGTTTIFPHPTDSEPLWTTLKSMLLPLLLPLGLIGFSLLAGAVQVIEKALRRVRKTNRARRRRLLSSLNINETDEQDERRTIIGFFHPYCNAGGGGERVLYQAISLHLALDPRCIIVIYTGDFPSVSKTEILAKAAERFGITVDADRVAMIGLERRWMVEEATWKTWTLAGQSYGSVWLGFEALSQLIPDVWIDTMGYAFTYPVARLLHRTMAIGAYVHYPILSTDMLERVKTRQATHTNDAATANSALRSRVKLVYYRVLAKLYAWVLSRADVVVANGSWTASHLDQLLWRRMGSKGKGKERVEVVYPPCDTEQLAQFALSPRSRTVVSLAQFRPEKEHPMQLHILARLRQLYPDLELPTLILMGSSRNEDDEARITLLRSLATQLDLTAHVQLVVNAPYRTILTHLAHAAVGISTMKDEHFGINVVEFMAAGLITLSHQSAGPYLDIATPSASTDADTENGVGFHATTVDQFAHQLAHILQLHDNNNPALDAIRARARLRAQSVFSTSAFHHAWQHKLWAPLHAKLHPNPSTAKKDD